MKYFIAFWCAEGIEYLEEVTDAAPENTTLERAQAKLSGEDYKDPAHTVNKRIQAMMLRGRYNPQRFYELYTFSAVNNVNLEDIEMWAEADAQSFVEWVRENGVCYLDDRFMRKETVIS